MTGIEPTEELRKELVAWVRKEIGPIASPDLIQFAPGLPKTRSGKIMRRILRKIAEDEPRSLGDTSTLADPAVVDDLVQNRQNKKGAPAVAPDAAQALFSGALQSRAMRRLAPWPTGSRPLRVPALRSSPGHEPIPRAAPADTSRSRSSRDLSGTRAAPASFRPSVVFKSFTLFRTFPLLPSLRRVLGARRGNHLVKRRG